MGETSTMKFLLTSLFLAVVSISNVNGRTFEWFKTKDAADCNDVDKTSGDHEKKTPPSQEDCKEAGQQICFCAKTKRDGWTYKCATCYPNEEPFVLQAGSPCSDKSQPSCQGSTPICQDEKEISKDGRPCAKGQGHDTTVCKWRETWQENKQVGTAAGDVKGS